MIPKITAAVFIYKSKTERTVNMKIYKLHQKALSALLTITMLLTLSPCLSFAQEEIIINTADQIISLANSRNKEDFSKNYRLANDIDMLSAEDERPMKAIGSYSNSSSDIAFNGIFDGDGHKIINLSTTGEALFGYIGASGEVKNLTLEKASIHYSQNDSSKYPAVFVSRNDGSLTHCMSINSTVVSDYCSPAGGFVGSNFGDISQCGVLGGSVSLAISKTGTSHGGFVGNQRKGSISECFSTAAVDAKKWAGGFAGKIEDGIISDCYALGSVKGSDENGGFAGALTDPAVIRSVYAVNDVNAVSGGGIAGGKGFSFADPGFVENSYYCSDSILPEATGNFTNDSSWAKSDDEIRTAEFALSLSDKWAYDENINGGYPYLINAVPPVSSEKEEDVTVQVMIADYDSSNQEFYKLSDAFDITVGKNPVTVKDIMESASENNLLTYSLGENEKSGQVITINDITPKAPDGWMFSVNGVIPSVGVSSAILSNGDKLLWFVGTPENGYIAPEWENIGISSSNFKLIATANDLAELSKNPDRWGENYKLTDNIDMSDIDFSPIGNSDIPFSGIFDGNGYEISNLTIAKDKNSQNIGMFGVISNAQLKNITLLNENITGGSVVGGLAGIAKSDSNGISLISNCHVSGQVTAIGTSYIKQTDAGGLIGVNDAWENPLSHEVFSSAIDNCTSEADVTGNTGAKDISDAGHIGGLVGLNKGIISNSSASGNVRGGNTTGGFVGSNYGGSIYSSNAQGNVYGAYTVGGFAGSLGLYSLTENCYSTGDVTALGANGANYGGFAGSVSGKAKNCISSGTLTPSWSYNGGFAGTFNGTIWSYNDDLRSLSGCYANCITNSGEKIKALGNYIGGVHIPTDTAANEISVDKAKADKKIEEMISKNFAENKLVKEASKYKSIAVIPSTVQEQADITSLVARLNANSSADSNIDISYESDSNAIIASSLGYKLNSKPDTTIGEMVTLSFAYDGVKYDKPITVTLQSEIKEIDVENLLKNIADKYADANSDYWDIVTVSAYTALYGDVKLSDDAKSEFISSAVTSIINDDTDTTLAMNIIALRSLGYDPANITAADGTKINAVEKLTASSSTGNNGDAYKLLAYHACGLDSKADSAEVIQRLLSAQLEEKGWSNNDDDGIDADSTGAVLLGLSPYYSIDSDVKAAADNAVNYLSSLMQTDGNIKSSYKESNYGTNANTSSICAMGLEAIGIDIKTDKRFEKASVSLFNGILGFASDDETYFTYEYADTQSNDMATKQSALAVMSAEKNVNALDFSSMPNNAIVLNDSKDSSTSSGGKLNGSTVKTDTSASSNKNIEVYFTLVGDTVHGSDKHTGFSEWLSEIKVEIAESSTVREVIEKVLKDNGYTVNGLEKGYVSEITTPDKITLGEYSNGPQSGWMYSVNGEGPTVGINDYIIKNGDKIKVYYSDSWQTASFADVSSDDWFFEAVEYTAQNNLIAGNEKGEFMPNTSLTRAMAVTILYRCRGEAVSASSTGFSDVDKNDWFAEAVSWASEKGIVSGVGNGRFAPNDAITREQLAAILYRFANVDDTFDDKNTVLSEFDDINEISDWGYNAICWAVNSKLINGMGDGTLSPKSTATRAQFAVILMNFNNIVK